MILFYNVENLFSPDTDSPNKNSGLRNWNTIRYSAKIRNIVKVLQLAKQEKQDLPALIGLCEIQGKKPLRDLLENEIFSQNFGMAHYESKDERGMDVALLYDKTKVELLSSEAISFLFEINSQNYDTTRDVLHCKIKYQNTIVNVFVVHLPSKRDLNINKPKREFILSEIKKRIENINQEAVIVMGDFNENPDSEMMQNFTKPTSGTTTLINPFLEIFRNRVFSTFHHKTGLLFDQIILSEDFFGKETFPLRFSMAEVFNHQILSNPNGKSQKKPYRTYSGSRYLGGFSDHFPVIVKLENNTENQL